MAANDDKTIREKFRFLDKYLAKEPFVFDLLNEILTMQQASLPDGGEPLATMEYLKTSRNINLPFTTKRDQNIEFLIEQLIKKHPEQVRPIVQFDFSVDAATKKLGITERVEYSVMLDPVSLERITAMRDRVSLDNLLELIGKFRFINLSKLLKNTQYKNDLTRVLKIEQGKTIFTFKHYNLDKNRVEWAEDYCFHEKNYTAVKNSIDIKSLREIITQYSEFVMRKLKALGIVNINFSDYRDAKLDYILGMLGEDDSSPASEKDLVELKNFNALRKCLLKADQILDPALTLEHDMVSIIRENKICTAREIIESNAEINPEIVKRWTTDGNPAAHKIIRFRNTDGIEYFIDGNAFIAYFKELNNLVVFEPEKLANHQHTDRKRIELHHEVMLHLTRKVLYSDDFNGQIGYNKEETRESLERAVEDFDNFQKKMKLHKELERKIPTAAPRQSIFERIICFFKRLFGANGGPSTRSCNEPKAKRKTLPKSGRRVYNSIVDQSAPVIALSDIIELVPENDPLVNDIIDELRAQNAKTVIPIYNARTVLYPKQSQQFLIPDIEYLLVPATVTHNYDTIRDFIESIETIKIRKEPITPKALGVIEKYLVSAYHQRRQKNLGKNR